MAVAEDRSVHKRIDSDQDIKMAPCAKQWKSLRGRPELIGV
jgi:hypothetical protein